MEKNLGLMRKQLLAIYENNLERADKTELRQLLGYSQAGNLKTYLKAIPDAYLNEWYMERIEGFFSTRGGLTNQLMNATNKKPVSSTTGDIFSQLEEMSMNIKQVDDTEELKGIISRLEKNLNLAKVLLDVMS